jgi:hypothetical protein
MQECQNKKVTMAANPSMQDVAISTACTSLADCVSDKDIAEEEDRYGTQNRKLLVSLSPVVPNHVSLRPKRKFSNVGGRNKENIHPNKQEKNGILSKFDQYEATIDDDGDEEERPLTAHDDVDENSFDLSDSDSISTNRPMTEEEKLYNLHYQFLEGREIEVVFKTGDGKAKWFRGVHKGVLTDGRHLIHYNDGKCKSCILCLAYYQTLVVSY